MNRAVVIAFVGLIGLYAILPAAHWTRPRVPNVPTHSPRPARVEGCQHHASRWNPNRSDASLSAWALCMGIRP